MESPLIRRAKPRRGKDVRFKTRKTLQRIGVDRRAHSDMLLDKAAEGGCLKIWDHSYSQSPRRLAAFLNSHQDKSGSTSLELTTSAQTRLGAANPSFVDLYLVISADLFVRDPDITAPL